MYQNDPTAVDNKMLEWMVTFVLEEAGSITVLPIAFGPLTAYSETGLPCPASMFTDDKMKTLPPTVPLATVAVAAELLQELGVQCSADRLNRFTVHGLVNDYAHPRRARPLL